MLFTIGRYIIEQEISKGAASNVYKAWDPKLDRAVVVKTVNYGIGQPSTEVATLKDRVYREARAIAKLNHPHIVVVHDVDDEQDFCYIVMEHLHGTDLRMLLQHEHRLECARAVPVVMQVCSALDYAHRNGIVHRDVKPGNIVLLRGSDKVKVTDFGIAKVTNQLTLTQPGGVLATPGYMAPEQIEGGNVDGRADIFSLGVVLYELITGKKPFVGDNIAALAYRVVHKSYVPPSLQNIELPADFDDIIGRALTKRPEQRYQTAAEFREALTNLQATVLLK